MTLAKYYKLGLLVLVLSGRGVEAWAEVAGACADSTVANSLDSSLNTVVRVCYKQMEDQKSFWREECEPVYKVAECLSDDLSDCQMSTFEGWYDAGTYCKCVGDIGGPDRPKNPAHCPPPDEKSPLITALILTPVGVFGSSLDSSLGAALAFQYRASDRVSLELQAAWLDAEGGGRQMSLAGYYALDVKFYPAARPASRVSGASFYWTAGAGGYDFEGQDSVLGLQAGLGLELDLGEARRWFLDLNARYRFARSAGAGVDLVSVQAGVGFRF